jgi:hypothetical protein
MLDSGSIISSYKISKKVATWNALANRQYSDPDYALYI